MGATVGEVLIRLGGDASGLEKVLSTSTSKVQRFGKDLEDVGRGMSVALTAPLALMGAGALKASIDFESAFTGVRKTVDGTELELKGLSDGIRAMAQEIPVAATELARIGEAAGQLGVETDQILGFTKVMADLGVTTNLASEEAATSLARLANITKMPQTEFSNLGSAIVALGNNFETTEAEIVSMALRIAGAGETIGLTEGDILGLATALSSVGINAEMGGSAISRTMIEIASSVEAGGEKLDEFARIAGVSTEQFAKMFGEEPAKAIQMFIEGLGRLKGEGESTFAVIESLELDAVQLRDALLRLANAGQGTAEAIKLGNDAYKENNALVKEAELRYSTTESKLTLFKNSLVELATIFGNDILPSFQSFVDSATGVAKGLQELDPATRSVIVQMTAMTAAAGPLAIIIGKLLGTSAIGGMVAALRPATKEITTTKTSIDAFSGALVTTESKATVAVSAMSRIKNAALALAPALKMIGGLLAFEMAVVGAGALARWASGVDAANAALAEAEVRHATVGKAYKDQAVALKEANDQLVQMDANGKVVTSSGYAKWLGEVEAALKKTTVGSEAHKILMGELNDVISRGKGELADHAKATQDSTEKTKLLSDEAKKLAEQAADAHDKLSGMVEDVEFKRATEGMTEIERAVADVEKSFKDAAKEMAGLVPPDKIAEGLRKAKEETRAWQQELGKLEIKKLFEDLDFRLLTADMNEAEKEAAALKKQIEEIGKQRGIKDVSGDVAELDTKLEAIRKKAADQTLKDLGKDWARRIEDVNPALDEFDKMLLQEKRRLEDLQVAGKLTGEEVRKGMEVATEGVRKLEDASKQMVLNLGKEVSQGMSGVVTGILEGTRDGGDVLGAFKDIGIGIVGKMFGGMLEEKLNFDAVFNKNFLTDLPGTLDAFGGVAEGIFGGIFGNGGSLSGIVESFAGGIGDIISGNFDLGSLGGLLNGNWSGLVGGAAGAAGGAGGAAIGGALGGPTGAAIGGLVGPALAQQIATHLMTGNSTLGGAISGIMGGTGAGVPIGAGGGWSAAFDEQQAMQLSQSLAQRFPQLAESLNKLSATLGTAQPYLSVAGGAYAGYSALSGPGSSDERGIEAGHQIGLGIAGIWDGGASQIADQILQKLTGTTFGQLVGGGPSKGQMSRRYLGNEVLGGMPSIQGLGETLNFDPYKTGVTSIEKAMERYPELFAAAGGAATAFGATLAAATDSGQNDAKEINYLVSTLIDNFGAAGLTAPQALMQIATAAQTLGIDLGTVAQVGIAQLQSQFDAGKITLDQYVAGLESINTLAGTTAVNTANVFSAFLEGGSVDVMRAAFTELGELGINTFGKFSSYIEEAFGENSAELVEEFKTLGIDSMTELGSLSEEQLTKIQAAMERSLGVEAKNIFTELRAAGVETMEALRISGEKSFQELAAEMGGNFLSEAKGVFEALKASGIENFTGLKGASIDQLADLSSRLSALGGNGQAIFEALRSNAITNFHELAAASKGQIQDLIDAINKIPRTVETTHTTKHKDVDLPSGAGGGKPHKALGGIVGGSPNSAQPIMAHGGELIVPVDMVNDMLRLFGGSGIGVSSMMSGMRMSAPPSVGGPTKIEIHAQTQSRRAEEMMHAQTGLLAENVKATRQISRTMGSARFVGKSAADLERHQIQTRGRRR